MNVGQVFQLIQLLISLQSREKKGKCPLEVQRKYFKTLKEAKKMDLNQFTITETEKKSTF